MNDLSDPFCGGIQCAVDRILRINTMNESQIQQVLERTDLQPSVRMHTLDRICRLKRTEKTSSLA